MTGAHSSLHGAFLECVGRGVFAYGILICVSFTALAGNSKREECFFDQINHLSKAERH